MVNSHELDQCERILFQRQQDAGFAYNTFRRLRQVQNDQAVYLRKLEDQLNVYKRARGDRVGV